MKNLIKSLLLVCFLWGAANAASVNVTTDSITFLEGVANDLATERQQPLPFHTIPNIDNAVAFGVVFGVTQELVITHSICPPDNYTGNDAMGDLISVPRKEIEQLSVLPPAGFITTVLINLYKCQPV